MRATTKVLSSSSRWVQRSKNDFFSRKSKELGLRSRAGFKLKEINDKFQIFKPKQIQNIVDLGFAPGAWSQICVQCCNGHSKILGVDILPCKPPRGVNSIQANIMSKKTHGLIKEFFGSEGEEFMKQLRKRTEVSRPSSPEVEYEAPLQGYGERSDLPVDVILSDMYEPFPQVTGFWNNTTNNAYYRMANTSGLRIKDHVNSVVSRKKSKVNEY